RATSCQEKEFQGRLPRAASCEARNSTSCTNRIIMLAIEVESGRATIIPAPLKVGASPQASVIRTGVLAAAASSATIPNDSYVDGMTTTVDCLYAECSIVWSAKPAKTTRSSSPS